MNKKIKPLGNRVLIKRLAAEVTKGGIILPEAAQEKPKAGEVIAVGEGKVEKNGKIKEMTVKTGDKVLFTSYAGTDVGEEKDNYLIMSEDDILAII